MLNRSTTLPDMRCARCGRVTLKPGATVGAHVFGPTCARIAGLVEPKQSRQSGEVVRDDRTLDLFAQIACKPDAAQYNGVVKRASKTRMKPV